MDVFAKKKGLERRRALLEVLQKQSMEAPIVGDTGIGQALAKLGTAYFNAKAGKGMDQEEAGVDQAYNQQLSGEVGNMLGTMQGQPGQHTLPPGMQGPQVPEVPPNPQAAVAQAMTSRFPEMQRMGQTMAPQMLAQPKGGRKLMVVNGRVISEDDPTKILANYDDPKKEESWSEPYTLGGDLYQKSSTGQIRKLDNAPKISSSSTTHVNMPAAEKEFDKRFGAKSGESLAEGISTRPDQLEALQYVQQGLGLLDQGIYTGSFADWKTKGAKVLGQAGIVDPAKAERTEQFVAYIGNVVLPRLKAIGGNDTEQERKYLEKITAGDITMEAGALKNVLQSVDAAIRRKVTRTDETAKMWQDKGKTGVPTAESLPPMPQPYGGKGAPAPATSAASPAKPGAWDAAKEQRYQEWKKQQGAR